jgi:hypothetical protein
MFIHYNAIRMMGKDHVGPFQEKRSVKPFQGVGAVYVNLRRSEVAIWAD